MAEACGSRSHHPTREGPDHLAGSPQWPNSAQAWESGAHALAVSLHT